MGFWYGISWTICKPSSPQSTNRQPHQHPITQRNSNSTNRHKSLDWTTPSHRRWAEYKSPRCCLDTNCSSAIQTQRTAELTKAQSVSPHWLCPEAWSMKRYGVRPSVGRVVVLGTCTGTWSVIKYHFQVLVLVLVLGTEVLVLVLETWVLVLVLETQCNCNV